MRQFKHKPVSATVAWLDLLSNIIHNGSKVSPRGIDTLELIGNQTVVDMNHPVVMVKERNISYQFMFAEAWWILSGRKDVKSIEPYAPSIGKFSDNGETFAGAYGPPFMAQLDYATETLAEDVDSRQSIIEIWSRNPRPSKDIPCTLTLQFLIRDGEIDCVASMRSSDAWIGYIYDVFNFSMMSLIIAKGLKRFGIEVELGNLHLTAGSQHLYTRNFPKAESIIQGNFTVYDHEETKGLGEVFDKDECHQIVHALGRMKDDEWIL